AAVEGILVKGPRTLERLPRVDTIVVDKTGTLTSGTLHVTRLVSYERSLAQDQLLRLTACAALEGTRTVSDERSLAEDELIRLTAAAEQGFTHPVARAIGRLARERRVVIPAVTATESVLGLGIDVRVEGRRVLIGSRRFMEQQ